MGQLSSFGLPTGAVKIALISLASVAQLVGVQSPNTPEGCRFNPRMGRVLGATNRCSSLASLFLSLPPTPTNTTFLSLQKQ